MISLFNSLLLQRRSLLLMLVVLGCLFYGLGNKNEHRLNSSSDLTDIPLVLLEVSTSKCETVKTLAVDSIFSNERIFVLVGLLFTLFIITPVCYQFDIIYKLKSFIQRPLFLIFCVFKE